MNPIIYISGPYRDPRGEYYVHQNILAAESAAIKIWQSGGVAICPHKNSAYFGGAAGIADEDLVIGNLAILTRCDAVFVVKHDTGSQGTMAEIELAQKCNMPVMYTIDDATAFIKSFR